MKSAATIVTLSILATATAAPEAMNAPQRMRSSSNKITSQPQREAQAENVEEPYDTFLGLRELQESMSMSMMPTEGSMPTEEVAVGPDGTPSTEEPDDDMLGVGAKSVSGASSSVVSGAISVAVLLGAYALF